MDIGINWSIHIWNCGITKMTMDDNDDNNGINHCDVRDSVILLMSSFRIFKFK